MANLFGVDFRSLMAGALGSQLYDATLAKITPGAVDISDPTAGNAATSANHTCKAVPTKITREYVDDSLVRHISGEVLVMLGTFSTSGMCPNVGDSITMVEPGTLTSITCVVSKVGIDPAGATATCEVHG